MISVLVSAWLAATPMDAEASEARTGTEAVETDDVDPPGYRELVQSALAEYARGLFPEAKALFAKAHALFPNARTLRALGMTEFELRDYVASAELLTAALASSARPLDADMRASVDALRVRAQGFTALLHLDLRPAQARLHIDARPVTLPASGEVRLAAGSHSLDVRAAGHRSETRSLALNGGDVERLEIELSRLPEPERPLRRSPWLWSALSVALVGAVVGTVLALKRRDPGAAPLEDSTTGQVLMGPGRGEER